MDCPDAEEMAEFYGRLLGWEVAYRDKDFIALRNPAGDTALSFQQEASTAVRSVSTRRR